MTRKASRPGLGYLIKWVERGVRAELNAALRPHGLNAAGYTALSVLGNGRELSSAQLARRAFISAQAVHPVVVELERRSLITRRRHPSHGRIQLVRLTARGKAVLAAADRACAAAEERTFAGLSQSEHEALRQTLNRCVNTMRRARAAEAA